MEVKRIIEMKHNHKIAIDQITKDAIYFHCTKCDLNLYLYKTEIEGTNYLNMGEPILDFLYCTRNELYCVISDKEDSFRALLR